MGLEGRMRAAKEEGEGTPLAKVGEPRDLRKMMLMPTTMLKRRLKRMRRAEEVKCSSLGPVGGVASAHTARRL